MLRRLITVALFFPLNMGAQSVVDFPRIQSVSTVTVVEEFLFFDLEPVIPQQPFRDWWVEMETCTGIAKPFDEVQWFVADAIYNVVQYTTLWGIYYWEPPEIILIRNQTMEQLEDTVKHEILHHLIKNTTHNEQTFVRCLSGNQEH